MLILTLKLRGIIPIEYPDKCECGWAFEVYGADGKLTTITCQNPECPISSKFNITELIQKLRLKVNMGEQKAENLLYEILDNGVKYYKSHFDVLALTPIDIARLSTGSASSVSAIQHQVSEINKNGGITLPLYMSIWCTEGLGDTYCQKIFSNYSTIQDFYNEYDKKQKVEKLRFIGSLVGISGYTDTVSTITKALEYNRSEYIRCSGYFTFKQVYNKTLTLCITGEISKIRKPDGTPFKPRDTFIEYLSDTYHITIMNSKSYTNSVDFVICDTPSSSRKSQAAQKAKRKDPKALEMIQQGIDPGNRLITSEKLIEMLEKGEI